MNQAEHDPAAAVAEAAQRLADAQDHLDTARAMGDRGAYALATVLLVNRAERYLRELRLFQESLEG